MHLTLMCQQLQVAAVSTSQNTSSKLKFNTGIIESVVSVNFKSVSAASITIPHSVDSDLKVLVWLGVGRFKCAPDSWLASYRQTHKIAQMLFKKQYPGTAGFVSTLLQYKPLPTLLTEGIQIIYCRACHWIAACKEKSSSDVIIYDSSLDSADDVTTNVITNLFEAQTVKVVSIQKQSAGSNNCVYGTST